MPTAWYTILTRHPKSLRGKWAHDRVVYETREQAVRAAHDLWDGTGITWRLMTVLLDDPDVAAEP
jgi:hypothetical protein